MKQAAPILGAVGGTLIAPGIGTALGAGLGASLGGMMGSATNANTPAPPPPIPAPAPMPTIDDAAVQAAKKRALLASQSTTGRASTILSSGQGASDKLGG